VQPSPAILVLLFDGMHLLLFLDARSRWTEACWFCWFSVDWHSSESLGSAPSPAILVLLFARHVSPAVLGCSFQVDRGARILLAPSRFAILRKSGQRSLVRLFWCCPIAGLRGCLAGCARKFDAGVCFGGLEQWTCGGSRRMLCCCSAPR